MSTNRSQLKTAFRSQIKTDKSGRIWQDDELATLAASAYLQVQVDGDFSWPENDNGSSTITLVAGTQEYAFDSTFGRLEIMMLNTGELLPTDFKDVVRRNPNNAQGTPSYYYIRGVKFGFDPVPNTSGTVNYYFRKILTPFVDDDSLIAFPDSFVKAIIQYMAYLAWDGIRDGGNLAAQHLDAYERELGKLFTTYQVRQPIDYRVQRRTVNGYRPLVLNYPR